jgi:biotin operon repressor
VLAKNSWWKSSQQTIHNLVNKLRSTGLLIDKRQKHKRRVLTEERLGDIGARLEHTPRKSLKHLAPEIGVSKSSARTAMQMLKLRPYKTAVIHSLQLCDTASRVHFCSWFLQPVIEDEIDLQLTLFSDVVWFHLQGYINTQTNCYWVHRMHI